jgi:BppU N-terminal domain
MALGDQSEPFPIKRRDTRPRLRYFATQGAPAKPVDLTGATAVFNMRLADTPNTVVISRQAAAILTPATGGGMEFTFTAAQTSSNGLFQAEFEVTFADGGTLTFPGLGKYIYVQVGDDIA